MRFPINLIAAAAALVAAPSLAQEVQAERVSFPSRDGQTEIVGYLFRPAGAPSKAPAVVMLHGRAGAYSSLAKDRYDASTLSARHKAWGTMLARNGYAALMVDDFGPLGYPQGFGRFTYDTRPPELDEVARRPLHAYGALRYLQARPDVDGTRVALLGWSNGGSATLAAMAGDKPGDMKALGFRTGIAIYPGCGLKGRYDRSGYPPYNPVQVFMGAADAEVSPTLCEKFVRRSKSRGGEIEMRMFRGAEHSYNSPTKARQSIAANVEAKASTESEVLAWLRETLAG